MKAPLSVRKGHGIRRIVILSAVLLVSWVSFARADWSFDWRVTDDTASSLKSYGGARAAVCDIFGRLHMVWFDDRTGTDEVYYSLFDGTCWQTETCISELGSDSKYPSVATDQSGNTF